MKNEVQSGSHLTFEGDGLIRGYRTTGRAPVLEPPVDFAVCAVEVPREPGPVWRCDAAMLAVVFLVAAIALSGIIPLWLDEILQVIDTRQPSATELLRAMPHHHPGSAPLGYLTQQAVLRAAGYSEQIARLPSALSGAGVVYLAVLLAAALRLHRPWVAGVVCGLLPLVVRYGTEARPYSLALFFATFATVVFVRGVRGWRSASLYAAALTAAVYSQPYAIFIGVAHAVWSLWAGERRMVAVGGVAVAAAAFLPWYGSARAIWAAVLPAGAVQFSASWKTPLMLLRELTGAGYWGSGLALLLCLAALWHASRRDGARILLMWCVLVPVVGAVACDAVFGYFLAVRQFLWVLPAMAVLVAAAIEERWWLPGALLIGVCLLYDVQWFRGEHEDWGAAASAIADQVRAGASWEAAPPDQTHLYEFFQPELAVRHSRSGRIVVAVSRYASTDARLDAIARLFAEGYHYDREQGVGGSRLILFSR